MDNKKLGMLIAVFTSLAGIIATVLAYLNGVTPIDPVPNASPSPVASVSPYPSPTISPSPAPSPSVSPSPKPSPSVSPSPVASVSPKPQNVLVSPTFERPEFVTSWQTSVTRTILDGQVSSFVLTAQKPCDLVGVTGLNKLLAVTLTKPSAPTYTAGTYYDALVPLTTANCADAKYLQIDLNASAVIGDASITIVKKATKAPAKPYVSLNVDLNNWTLVSTFGGYTKSTGNDALQALQLLKDHRVSPYKGQEVHSVASWQQFVAPFSLGSVYIDNTSNSASYTTLAAQPDAWAYIVDEPAIGNTATISTDLANWIKNVPSAKPMMTAPIKQRDYRQTIGGVTNPYFAKTVDWPADIKAGIKLFVPVAEQFCQETWAGSGDWYACAADYAAASKQFGLYISNMSHGNEGGAASGAPDLVIDRSAVEPFGFFALAVKYGTNFLLYYNSIQGWGSQDVYTNPYVYGGNGDGILLYPDVAAKKAYPSIRLKLLREASQLVDIVSLAKTQADIAALITSTTKWDHDLSKFEAARTKALGLLP